MKFQVDVVFQYILSFVTFVMLSILLLLSFFKVLLKDCMLSILLLFSFFKVLLKDCWECPFSVVIMVYKVD